LFEIIFTIVIVVYAIQSIIFVLGVQKEYPKIKEDELTSITVIVACRNEEKNILRCLTALDELEYPKDKLEIIIVDDNSTDQTGAIIDEFIVGKPKFNKIVTCKEIENLRGKTNALANALEIAKGEIILTTDADCAVSKTWAKTIASYYTENVAVVNGFTPQENQDHFSGMQNLDFLYLLTVSAGTINFNTPLSCMGNNMSYRKSVYDEVGGYQNLSFSVTEDFNLLMAIHSLKKYKIIYPLDKESSVVSKPCTKISELYHQKKRWAVGGLKAPLMGFLVVATGFITHLMIILSFFFLSSTTIVLTFFKILIDYLLLLHVSQKLENQKSMKYFLTFEFYYLIYVALLPFAVLFNQNVHWKGRKY